MSNFSNHRNKVLRMLFIILTIFNYHLSIGQVDVADSLFIYTDLDKALKEPNKVYNLDLSKKKLTEFPMEVFKFKNLKSLVLSKNKIKSVPDKINELSNLRELDLGHNKLTEFNKAICDLINLERLILNQNEIESIPPEVKKLTKMTYLDMWDNELWSFPDELNELENTLKEMDLRHIQYNYKEQENIKKLLPKTLIHLSAACNCGN